MWSFRDATFLPLPWTCWWEILTQSLRKKPCVWRFLDQAKNYLRSEWGRSWYFSVKRCYFCAFFSIFPPGNSLVFSIFFGSLRARKCFYSFTPALPDLVHLLERPHVAVEPHAGVGAHEVHARLGGGEEGVVARDGDGQARAELLVRGEVELAGRVAALPGGKMKLDWIGHRAAMKVKKGGISGTYFGTKT